MEQIKRHFKKHIYYSKEPTNIFQLILIVLLVATILIFIYSVYLSTSEEVESLFFELGAKKASKITSLSVISDKPFYQESYKVGDLIEATIVLDAPLKKVSGVDIFLDYDPSFLEIQQKRNPSGSDEILKYLDVGFSSFDIFPYLKIDKEKGRAIFSALVKPLGEFVGINKKVAALNFRAIKKGETEIKINFSKHSTLDSNVSYAGTDILENVRNLKITIE